MSKMEGVLLNCLFIPDTRLIQKLEKSLTCLEIELLNIWLEEERNKAALLEWEKQKHRIPKGM